MENQDNQIVKTGEWVVTFLIAAIPLVGFIMLFVWAFGDERKVSKANWAKATLIWYLIAIGLVITVGVFVALIFGAAFSNLFGNRF